MFFCQFEKLSKFKLRVKILKIVIVILCSININVRVKRQKFKKYLLILGGKWEEFKKVVPFINIRAKRQKFKKSQFRQISIKLRRKEIVQRV